MVFGSRELVRSLLRRNVVDEFVVQIHPVVLGSGRRLFPDGGASAKFRLVASKTTGTGVVIAIYALDGQTAAKATYNSAGNSAGPR